MRWTIVGSALFGLGVLAACGSGALRSETGGPGTGAGGSAASSSSTSSSSGSPACTPVPCDLPCFPEAYHYCLDGTPYGSCDSMSPPFPDGTSCGSGVVCVHSLCVGDGISEPPVLPNDLPECGGKSPPCVPGPTDACAHESDAGASTCQLVDGFGGWIAQCGTPGSVAEGQPCTSNQDCGPELGCVIHGAGAVCRAYCCAGADTCAPGTYCAPATAGNPDDSAFPVCLPATPCTLLDDTTCPQGLTCTVVRDDGTTSCVTHASLNQGLSCDCPAGSTCTWPSGKCAQLCHVGGNDCATGSCQGGPSYPAGFGVCP